MKIAVLGAGNGAFALAGDLTFMGCDVNLFNRSMSRIEPIIKLGGLEVSTQPGIDVKSGFAKLNKITANIGEAMDGVKLIFVTTTANGHGELSEAMAPYVRDGQTIVFIPGYGGSLECTKIFRDKGITADVTLADSLTLFHGCRKESPTKVRVSVKLKNQRIAALPSNRTKQVLTLLKPYYSVKESKNVLETMMLNPNPVIHPLPAVMNVGSIEADKTISSYNEYMSPLVLKCLDRLDLERKKICEALGLSNMGINDVYWEWGIGPIYRPDLSPAKYKEVQSRIYHWEDRFLTEDVPFGIVPWSFIGDMTDVPTPIIDSVVHLASALKETDYFADGLNLEDLGIAGLSSEQLNEYLDHGART